MPVIIRKIKLHRKDFDNIPSKDRALLLLSGHTLNVIATWNKLARYSSNPNPDSEEAKAANAVQSQILLRSLLGALAEAYEWIRGRGNQQFIRTHYASAMSAEAILSFQIVQRRFGKNSLLHSIRNKIAYHYPEDHMVNNAITKMQEDEDCHWLHGDHIFNFVFLSSESAVSFCLIDLSQDSNLEHAFQNVVDESILVSEHLVRYLAALIDAIAIRYLGNRYGYSEEINIDTKMNFNVSRLDYFCKFD
jgi:hypothetical protein